MRATALVPVRGGGEQGFPKTLNGAGKGAWSRYFAPHAYSRDTMYLLLWNPLAKFLDPPLELFHYALQPYQYTLGAGACLATKFT